MLTTKSKTNIFKLIMLIQCKQIQTQLANLEPQQHTRSCVSTQTDRTHNSRGKQYVVNLMKSTWFRARKAAVLDSSARKLESKIFVVDPGKQNNLHFRASQAGTLRLVSK